MKKGQYLGVIPSGIPQILAQGIPLPYLFTECITGLNDASGVLCQGC
jgi:hypothetical protein